jgi:hypothetical protein
VNGALAIDRDRVDVSARCNKKVNSLNGFREEERCLAFVV